jgi:hypothetical protein
MIIAYYTIHYGSDYLGWSIKSVYDFVDKIYILYTSTPSQGFSTNLGNPDTREKLVASAYLFGDPKNKIQWIEGQWPNEGAHRAAIKNVSSQDCPDMILAVDSDEIWYPDVLENSIKEARDSKVDTCVIRMLTLWRSFSWSCTDEMQPIRITLPKMPQGTYKLQTSSNGRVLHFGYARDLASIRYKMTVQGHRAEWRPEWYSRYENWPLSGNNDFHPVVENVWNAIPFDKSKMPAFMREHPYYNLEVIS